MKKSTRKKKGPSHRVSPSTVDRLTPAAKATGWLSKSASLLEQTWFLPAVLVLAGLLRLSHVFAIRRAPWLQHMQLDHLIYDQWGQRIAAGDWIGSEAYFVDPLYAYFLAIIYWFSGHRPVVVLVIQAFLGVGTCYLTCLIGRKIFSRRLGNLACLLMALYAPAIYYEALIEKTALSLFLFTLSIVLYLGRTRRQIMLAGVALGLAALTRGNFLLFIPLGALALLLRNAEGPTESPPVGAQRWWSLLRSRARLNGEIAARFFMVAFLVVTLTVIRNSLVAGVTATTTNAGQNLYIGNHAGNVDGTYSTPSFVRPDPRFEEADFRAEAERRAGHTLNPQEISSYWGSQALSEMAEHPGLTLGRTIKKVRLFWHDYEVPDNGNMYLAKEDSIVLKLPLLSLGILFPWALLGAILSFRTNVQARLLTLIAAAYSASVVAFFILARFRIQILPILAVLAAFGGQRLVQAAYARSWRGLAIDAGVVFAGIGFSLVTPPWIQATKAPSLAIGYNNLGALYAEEGQIDRAIDAYEKAIQTQPQSVVGAMRSVGDLYLGRREYDKAETHMQHVLELKPDSRMGREALVRLYEQMSREAYAGDKDRLRQKLAAAYRGVGRIGEAERLMAPSVLDVAKNDPESQTRSPGPIDQATANAIVRGLSSVAPGRPVWFTSFERSEETEQFYRALRALFVRAGWVIQREDRTSFPLKPGLSLLAADEQPPEFVTAIPAAFMKAGVNMAFNTGYRSYYDDMKRTKPTWNGFAMSADQTFTIVVGPQPSAPGARE